MPPIIFTENNTLRARYLQHCCFHVFRLFHILTSIRRAHDVVILKCIFINRIHVRKQQWLSHIQNVCFNCRHGYRAGGLTHFLAGLGPRGENTATTGGGGVGGRPKKNWRRGEAGSAKKKTPWILFVDFLFYFCAFGAAPPPSPSDSQRHTAGEDTNQQSHDLNLVSLALHYKGVDILCQILRSIRLVRLQTN